MPRIDDEGGEKKQETEGGRSTMSGDGGANIPSRDKIIIDRYPNIMK